MKTKRNDTVLVGKIGTFEVRKVDATAVPCLVIEKTWLSRSKIKAVLANDAACRLFLAQYDLPPEPKAAKIVKLNGATQEVEALRAELAALRATISGQPAPVAQPARLDPAQVAE